MKRLKNKSGITLIALVITILVLLILAGVAINLTIGERGIFNQSKLAAEKYEEARQKEENEMAIDYNELAFHHTRGTITVSEEEWNKADKVETISTTKLCYENKTLNYDFSKYKRVRCYAHTAMNGSIIFEIDLGIENVQNIEGSTDKYYGSACGIRIGDEQDIFVVAASVNNQKNLLTIEKIGYMMNATFNDRLTSGNSDYYNIYKIEGIY